jgi:hypothetical protein
MACSFYSTGFFSQQAEGAMPTIAEWPKGKRTLMNSRIKKLKNQADCLNLWIFHHLRPHFIGILEIYNNSFPLL